MANTYTQIFVQIIFAVKGRQNIINESLRDSLEKYICGIIKNNNSKTIAIYCNTDHLHVLISLHPTISIANLTGEIKSSSTNWINQNQSIKGKFYWQDGYGAFTYSKSQIHDVATYILNQPQHHVKKTFKDECLSILQKAEIDYHEAYLFDWLDISQ